MRRIRYIFDESHRTNNHELSFFPAVDISVVNHLYPISLKTTCGNFCYEVWLARQESVHVLWVRYLVKSVHAGKKFTLRRRGVEKLTSGQRAGNGSQVSRVSSSEQLRIERNFFLLTSPPTWSYSKLRPTCFVQLIFSRTFFSDIFWCLEWRRPQITFVDNVLNSIKH